MSDKRPAFYAARQGKWRDWWTLLHPPYTAWHLSYVVIGASLAPVVSVVRMVATLGGFFLAVGVAAHAYDELQGRPLRTRIGSPTLVIACAVSLAGAITLGVVGIVEVGPVLVPFVVVGPVLVLAYNAELWKVHSDLGFALCWGAFPLLTAYVAEASSVSAAATLAAAAAAAASIAQRALSSPARQLRRHVADVHGEVTLPDGSSTPLTREDLLRPLERGLGATTVAIVLLAAGLAVARLG
ncbi:MAG: hypothetical protein ACRDWE_08700 [Acidimicrobiales bacterium]